MKIFRDLKVKLTEAEWSANATALAQEQAKRAATEAERALAMGVFKERLEGHKAIEAKLGEKVRSREETRAVECSEVPDFKRFVMDLIRLDTGELVETRPMVASERQVKLPGVTDDEEEPN